MEYTLISLAAVLLSGYYASRKKVSFKPLLIAASICLFFQLIFDNLMTSFGLWVFDFSYTLGLALPFIPLENLLFGLALMISTIASWEQTC